MSPSLLTAALLALALPATTPTMGASLRLSGPAQSDTILDVRPGEGLLVKNLGGRISVEGWERDEMEVSAERGGAVEVRRANGNLVLRDALGHEGRRARAYLVRVPRWMRVQVGGIETSVEAQGLNGGFTARTVEGSVYVKGSRGAVDARSVNGVVEVEDVVGDVVASSADEDVVLRNVRGSVRVENVDGDIRLRGVDGSRVDAQTVDGDVEFEGPLRAGGEYRLVTHDGDLRVTIPDGPDVTVFVSTHDGQFQSDFRVTVDRLRGGHEFRFTLGEGSASLHLEAFDGDIRLLRR